MRRTIALSLIFFVLFTCITFSCKRNDDVDNILTRLLHNWKLAKIATDDNGNGAIDATEIQPLTNGEDDEMIFNKDYTGAQTVIAANGVKNNYPFTWSLTGKDTITRNGLGYNLIKYHIETISAVSLELTTHTEQGILAAYFYDRK